MSKLVLVGPLPPAYHGQSVSFKMLADSLAITTPVEVINIADKNLTGKSGTLFLLARILQYILIICNFIRVLSKGPCRVYITIAQSRSGFIRDFLMIWIAKLFRSPVVIHLKGGNYDGFYNEQPIWLKFLIRKTLLKVERILVLGKNLLNMYDFEPKLKERLFIVENGLPFELANEKHKTVNSTRIELLFLSNLIESKGYLDILDAIAKLPNKELFHINFAGAFHCNFDDVTVQSESHAKEQFYSRIKSLGIIDNVTYHGVVNGDEKLNLLRSSHIFLLPTNYSNEGQPVSIIEALAFGIPIVTTDYRAISDMVIPYETGMFVKYGSSSDIADALIYISKNDNYSRMSKACIKQFKSKFTRDKHLLRITPHIKG